MMEIFSPHHYINQMVFTKTTLSIRSNTPPCSPAACPKNISLLARAQQINALTPCPACKAASKRSDQNPLPSLREQAGKEGSSTAGRMGVGECKSNDYGAAAYWDARYSSGSPASAAAGCGFFDWYQTYPALRSLLRARVPVSSRVLMLGCGNSRTSPFSHTTHKLLLFAVCNYYVSHASRLC